MNTAAHRPAGHGPYRTRDGRSTRWEAHRVARREELLSKARRAIHEIGAEASMEEIAQYAGTSKSVFYRYFRDKNGLGQALGESLLAHLEARIAEAVRRDPQDSAPPRAVVARMIEVYLVLVQRSPALHAFVTSQAGLGWSRPSEAQRPTASLGLFADHVSRLLLEALGPVPDQALAARLPDPDQAAHLLHYWARSVVGLVHAAAEQWAGEVAAGTAPDRDLLVRQLSAWVLSPMPAPTG
ncbi:TetR/AcrR family transcriptional regulator [Rothia kristinae]|uniref:TetR/AcrR family transcriptional regulator n=1 Tax=Rothia kristinae TaxID=37923 RepID=A0A7T3CHF7_9MICC|nr:TetR/AcrR family transcriptional regulator [Rothia kristinae]QPT53454.1 TetR/AcrR family transcriptional regulator [Rothia kristinae]SQC29006.1 transcriptional regulator BetI [Rothia kristinae]